MFRSPKDIPSAEPARGTGLSVDELEKLIDERVEARLSVELPRAKAEAAAEAWRALPRWFTRHCWEQRDLARKIVDKHLQGYSAHLDGDYIPTFFANGKAVPLPYGALAQERTLAQSYLARDPFEAALSNARAIPDGLLGTGQEGAAFRVAIAEELIRRGASAAK